MPLQAPRALVWLWILFVVLIGEGAANNDHCIRPTRTVPLGFVVAPRLDCAFSFAKRKNTRQLPWSQQPRRNAFSVIPLQGTMTMRMVKDESDLDANVQMAVAAVRRACRVVSQLQQEIGSIGRITKTDASPVTVADFAAQAMILQELAEHHHELNDDNVLFLAEESSDQLTPPVTAAILDAYARFGVTTISDEATLRASLDLGQSFFRHDSKDTLLSDDAHREGRRRVWCLDPIDGTKGFLRKEQYCVALALLDEEGKPTIGILGCPNLPLSSVSVVETNEKKKDQVGCIFVAQKGKGCFELPLDESSSRPMLCLDATRHSRRDIATARFCVGVEEGFGDPLGRIKGMARSMHGRLDAPLHDGVERIAHAVRMDSQAKYGVVARGDAECYVRLATNPDWIWDVAAGVVVLEEAGGVVTDAAGEALDFTQANGRLTSHGVLGATTREIHQALLEAHQQEL